MALVGRGWARVAFGAWMTLASAALADEPTTPTPPSTEPTTTEPTSTEPTSTEPTTTEPTTTAPTTTEPTTTEPTTTPSGPPQHQLFVRSTAVLRVNPLGLISDTQLSFRRLMYRRDDTMVLRDNFVGAGIAPQFSPAFARLGALVEVQPLSMLRLWASFEVVGYFGTFGLFQSFDSPHADFRDSTISARGRLQDGDPAKSFATWGTQLNLGADLQMKLGPIAARNLARVVRGDYQMRAGDTVYYDQFYDVLAPNRGFYVNNDTDVLFMTDFGLVVGARMNTTMPLYGPEHDSALERTAETLSQQNGPTLRLGPVITYTLYDDPSALINKPTILMIGNWWLAHRYRTGVDVSQLMPYFLIGFQVTTDLLPHITKRKENANNSSR